MGGTKCKGDNSLTFGLHVTPKSLFDVNKLILYNSNVTDPQRVPKMTMPAPVNAQHIRTSCDARVRGAEERFLDEKQELLFGS